MKRGKVELDAEESFYLYHLICTYTTGDYRQPRRSTKEAAREVANRIRTGCETLKYNRREYFAVAKSFNAEGDVPISYPDNRELFEKLCDNAPRDETTPHVNYGPRWEDTREEVLQRDGYQCRRCGETQEEHKQRVGHGLHIHHIVPIRRFDSYERANQKTNLSVLCVECHQEVESMEEPPEDVINEAFDESDLG